MEIDYLTRDGKGKEFVKKVKIKEFQTVDHAFVCQSCGRRCDHGVPIKACTSSKFTDWQYVGDYMCTDCTRLLSLYFYSYSVEGGEIHLFNLREIYENIMRSHTVPFKFIVSKTGKKHLFYRAPENMTDDQFAIQFETETVYTNRERMRRLFDFCECMQTLGVSKLAMSECKLPMNIMKESFGLQAYLFLRNELTHSREIQIPLHCGQKRDITEEDAKCCIISVLTM